MKTARREKLNKKLDVQKIFFALMFVGILVFFTLLNPKFLSIPSLINISRQMSERMIMAVGLTFCLISGGVDLSIAKTGVMAGCVAAVVMVNLGGTMNESLMVAIAVLIALLVSALIGLINGVVIAKLRVLPFIATMGTMTIAYGIAMLVTDGNTISKLPKAFYSIGTGYILKDAFANVKGVQGIPIAVLIMIAVVILGWFILTKTEFGLNVFAIGGNYKAAKLAGLNNEKMLISVYVISSVLSSIAGMILAARMVSAQPGLWEGVNLEVIAGCVIGGTSMRGGIGSMVASFLGILLMTCMTTGLNLAGIEYSWQQILTGVLVIAAVSIDMISRKKDV